MTFVNLVFGMIIVLSTTRVTLNKQYGKVSEYPLRRKLIEDTTNIILFLILFWYTLRTTLGYRAIIYVSLMALVQCILVKRHVLKYVFWNVLELIKEKQLAPHGFKNLILRLMENWKPFLDEQQDTNIIQHNGGTYREYVILAVSIFCSRTITVFIFGFTFLEILTWFNAPIPGTVLAGITTGQKEFLELFVLINSVGLTFTSWKFYYDYKEIRSENVDNPRLADLAVRMYIKEREI